MITVCVCPSFRVCVRACVSFGNTDHIYDITCKPDVKITRHYIVCKVTNLLLFHTQKKRLKIEIWELVSQISIFRLFWDHIYLYHFVNYIHYGSYLYSRVIIWYPPIIMI